jgi:hypothetical protein
MFQGEILLLPFLKMRIKNHYPYLYQLGSGISKMIGPNAEVLQEGIFFHDHLFARDALVK